MDCRSVASLGLDFSHIALHSVSVAFVCNIICVHGTLFDVLIMERILAGGW